MQELVWLDHLPDNSLIGGIALANDLYWNITTFQSGLDGRWYVKGGESTIFISDSREAMDAFLYGMGLAYAVLPPEVWEPLVEGVRKLVE